MVRVGSLFDMSFVSPNDIDNKSGMTPVEQLSKIYNSIPSLIELKKQTYASVMDELSKYDIFDLEYHELSLNEQKFVDSYFKKNIKPILSPIIIGKHHPAPHLTNKNLYVTVLLSEKKDKHSIGFVPIPEVLPAYLQLSSSKNRWIRIENIILHHISSLFGIYSITESCVISITRNADIRFDDEKFEENEEDFLGKFSKLLKKRDRQSVVRMEVSKKISDHLLSILMKLAKVEKRQVFYDSCPLNMKYVFALASEITQDDSRNLIYKSYQPRWPEDISQNHSVMEQVFQKDKLLFFPFDSVDPFLKLLNEASENPDVISIKITIYRLASSSKIARLLCRAAENGKDVTVLMELRARFDEANNVSWSKILEDSGCQVVFGIDDFKCHSKICLITMKSGGKMRYITQVGTGNYNEKTTTLYTDLSILTASEQIGEDAVAFFQNMLINNLHGEYQKLLVAPTSIKSTILSLIDKQIQKKEDGFICIKANSLTEREVIDKLREASQSGVEVQLIIRGICCILPNIPTYTDNIHVTSIVGRYLEHSRIYCFGKGNDAEIYISSADLMTRNLNKRVEIACPIEDSQIKEQIQWILDSLLKDNVKAEFLMSDGLYTRKQSTLSTAHSSQEYFMRVSPHQNTEFVPPKKSFLEKISDDVGKPISKLYSKLFKNN